MILFRPPSVIQYVLINILTPSLCTGSSSSSFFLVADPHAVSQYHSADGPPICSSKATEDVESFPSSYLLSQPVINIKPKIFSVITSSIYCPCSFRFKAGLLLPGFDFVNTTVLVCSIEILILFFASIFQCCLALFEV
jgi:hypothetical protein